MELLILASTLLLLGGAATYTAISTHQPLFSSVGASPLQAGPAALNLVAFSRPAEARTTHKAEPVSAATSFSDSDVLLADALAEMVSLKAELYYLRKKVETLNVEVARLSGDEPTPPAAIRKPAQLRRVA